MKYPCIHENGAVVFPASMYVSLKTLLSPTESKDKKFPCHFFLIAEAGRGAWGREGGQGGRRRHK